jgi:AraC-like DNA-binding protein
MTYLRTVRLERVRQDLLNDATLSSVTAAALRWGFAHLGRFSVEYRRAFGECPGNLATTRSGLSRQETGSPQNKNGEPKFAVLQQAADAARNIFTP